MNSAPTWRYRLLLCLISPVIMIHLIWRSFRDGGWRYFYQRCGYSRHDPITRRWIHAASVGEIMTVLPLLEKIQHSEHALPTIVTTNTPTGAQVLLDRLPADVVHCYLPIDWSSATARFFNHHSISEAWVVETEIWPWLFARCQSRNIPLTIINARLSQRTKRFINSTFSQTYRRALTGARVLARSAEDATGFIELGANSNRVEIVGNLKFSIPTLNTERQPLIEQDYCTAASTHHDEELQLAIAWLKAGVPCLLVLVPRHPERGKKIARQLQAVQSELAPTLPAITQRSIDGMPTERSRLYVADTLGELPTWYASSRAVFVGGSLIQHGGQNIIEPARCGKAVIVGPSMFNFKGVMQDLSAVNAVISATDADAVVAHLKHAVDNPGWAASIGQRAREVTLFKDDIIAHYLRQLFA